MEEIENNQEVQMEHSSGFGAALGVVGVIGMSAAVWNNGYRMGRMGNLWRKVKNAEIVNKLVEGEKIAGNFKLPFTDVTTRFGVGERINTMLRGSPEAVGGFGFSKGHKTMFGLSEGRGLGYNFSFDKRILDDIESGFIDKDLLKKNFLERHAVLDKEGKFLKGKKKNLTKEEFSSLLNDSINKEKYFLSEQSTYKFSRKEANALVDDILGDIRKGRMSTGRKKVIITKELGEEIKKELSEKMFKKENGTLVSNITKEGFEEIGKSLKKKGIRIAETEMEKIATKTIEKRAAKFVVAKGAKYTALTPMLAAGPVGAAVAGVVGAGFAAFDIITGVKMVSDLNNEIYNAKKEKNKTLSMKGRSENYERASNSISMQAASSSFQTLQQTNFGLSNLLRTKNMAGSFLSEKL